MNEEKLQYRMYCLALRHLSSINKGIQNCHSCLEYANKYHDTPEYQKYIKTDKTMIMLDGGTLPDLVDIAYQLDDAFINFAAFQEPDLGDIVTSIVFIADERVWDRNYDYENFCHSDEENSCYEEWVESIGGLKNLELRNILAGKRLSM
jgi:hypothetical protein